MNKSRPYFDGFDPTMLPSPAFVVDKAAIQYNLDILNEIMAKSGAKIILALKGFAMFHLAEQISSVLKGTAASSLHEARLGREEFGGEVHIYSPAFKKEEMPSILKLADHIVFNSFSQLRCHLDAIRAAHNTSTKIPRIGMRINPEYSEGTQALYDPCAAFSRMGVIHSEFHEEFTDDLSGLHFHTLCEQGAEPLKRTLEVVLKKFGNVLKNMEWINFGGGHYITKEDYNHRLLIDCVKMVQDKYGLEVYLEPGEAIAVESGVLKSIVLDTIYNGMDLAIVDASATCHMPDVLEMPYRPEIWGAGQPLEKQYLFRIGGQTCLAGDIIGDYSFDHPLQEGEHLIFDDMSHYTMVKTTTFNGIPLPTICTYDSRNRQYEIVKEFRYEDFRDRLS